MTLFPETEQQDNRRAVAVRRMPDPVGGLGHAGNWGYQVPAILSAGCRAILIDSRGHGRSTRDDHSRRERCRL